MAELTCPACGERGSLRENASVSIAPAEPFPAVPEPEPPPPISSRTLLARRKRGSGLAFLVRLTIVAALGGVLAHWAWHQIGAPQIVIQKDADGAVKEIKVVPTQ